MADGAKVDHLAEYKALTRRLHDLELRGLLESEEADAVRDASDPHWYAMTEAEIEKAARYSGWLDDNVTEPGGGETGGARDA